VKKKQEIEEIERENKLELKTIKILFENAKADSEVNSHVP